MLTMKTPRSLRRAEAGFTLLEALVALLIFSIGFLALIALQITSIRMSSNAKYRSDAALLANQMIANLWVSDRVPANMQTAYGTGGANYDTWLGNVQATLPGVAAAAASAPTVQIGNDGTVTIDLYWKAPNEQAADAAHRYTAVAQIR